MALCISANFSFLHQILNQRSSGLISQRFPRCVSWFPAVQNFVGNRRPFYRFLSLFEETVSFSLLRILWRRTILNDLLLNDSVSALECFYQILHHLLWYWFRDLISSHLVIRHGFLLPLKAHISVHSNKLVHQGRLIQTRGRF